MHTLALTAIGRDRPGIVAGVTRVLFEQGCNLSDCSMARLSGQFAMIMSLECPDGLDREALERALDGPAATFGLSVTLQELEGEPEVAQGVPFVVSVYGADRPGIVYRVSDAIAQLGANVTNLESRAGSGIYTVVLELEVPQGRAGRLEGELTVLAREVGVDLAVRPADTDPL